MELLTQRYRNKIGGVLSCFDRVILTGTIPEICHQNALALYLNIRKIRFFDYPRWAKPLRDEIRQNAERRARENGLEIEYIRRLGRRVVLTAIHIRQMITPALAFRPL